MASSSDRRPPPPHDDTLGKDLEKLGKILNASATMQKIASETTKIMEDLRSSKTEAEKIDFNGPYLRQFVKALDRSIDVVGSLCKIAMSMGEIHLECVEAFKKMPDQSEITPKQVDTMATNWNGILSLCEEFAKNLSEFMGSLKDASDHAEMALCEAKREEDRLKREAAKTRSEAEWKSVWLWFDRIGTLGLITFSSEFQEAAAKNDERYEKANRLEGLEQRFHKAYQVLNKLAQGIDTMKVRVQGGPIRLTQEMIEVVKKVIQMNAQSTQMKEEVNAQRQILLTREKTIEEQKAALIEKDAENARLKAELEQMKAAQKKNA